MIAEEKKENKKERVSVSDVFIKYGLGIFALLIVLVFYLFEPKFLSVNNIMNILWSASVIGISSLGLSIILSTGEIDFAAGAEFTVVSTVLGFLLHIGFVGGYPIALLLALGLAVLIGVLNAFLNINIGIPAFIATMGVSLICTGVAYGLTEGLTFKSPAWGSAWRFIGQTYVFGVIPVPVILLVVFAVIMWIYGEYTIHGKNMYAVGSNPTATKYVGINSSKQKLQAFIICSVLCGISGILAASQYNATAYTLGDTVLFQAITGIMLGATFLHPGVINVPGTLLGALIVIIMQNGFTMTGVPTFARDMILGVVMLVAVTVVTSLRKRAGQI